MQEYAARLYLVDQFRETHLIIIEWTWIGRDASCQRSSYLNRMLVDLDLLKGSSFESFKKIDHWFVYVTFKLDKD